MATYNWADEKIDKAIATLKDLKRNWPESTADAEHETLDHCGELIDEISDLVHELDVALGY